jgi:nitrous oxidase accessory protein
MGINVRRVAVLLLVVVLTASPTVIFLPVKAAARTILVPDHFSTIEAAIANANDGDTIFIRQGTYEGSINQTLVINKAISLCGENKKTTVINLCPALVQRNIFSFYYMSYLDTIQITSDNVKISGLTINTPSGGISATGDGAQIVGITAATGVSIDGSRAIISGNTLKGDLNVIGNSNTIAHNLFQTGIVGPSFDFVGSNNLIIDNRLAYQNDTWNIKLDIEGSNNIIAHNLLDSIYLKGEKNIIYKNCMKVNPGYSGVYLSHSSRNTICANRITYDESITYQQEGVTLSESYDNIVYANHIKSVFKGVYLQNTDTEPMVTNNNTFYHNNFVNNQIQAWDTTSSTTNRFDNGEEGNYWSCYNGTDADNDGIGDTPYRPTALYTYDGLVEKITECGPDNYPLMSPFDIDSVYIKLPELASSPTPSSSPVPSPTPTPAPTPIQVPGQNFYVESNSTVTDLFFNTTSSELFFTVNGTTGTEGYVKVTVPKSLLPNVQNVKVYLDERELDVTVTSDETSWFLSFNYLHSSHNVKISLTGNEATAPLLGIEWVGISAAVIAVVVGFCLLFYFKKRNC